MPRPLLPYLNGGEPILAEQLNTMLEELDRIVALALDDHCLPFLLGTRRDLTLERLRPYFASLVPTYYANQSTYLTNTAFFGSGPQPISGYWGTWQYDHAQFEAALAAAVAYTGPTLPRYDAGPNKWAVINPLPASYWTTQGRTKTGSDRDLLAKSLETHQWTFTPPGGDPELYWVQESFVIGNPTSTVGTNATPSLPQRKYAFQQVDILLEGFNSTLRIPAKWNKNNRWRFNNCDRHPTTVEFLRADGTVIHSLVVPAQGSKCVRRDSPEGTYTNGFRYFQKSLYGDPRFWSHPTTDVVANPNLLVRFIKRVLAGEPEATTFLSSQAGVTYNQICAPTVMLDPHVRAPLTGAAAALYGAVTDATKVGDVLFHKGEFLDVRTDPGTGAVTSTTITFNGCDALMTVNGLSVEENGDDLRMRSSEAGVQHDFIAKSTNLFCTGVGSFLLHPVIDGSAWFTLDRHMAFHDLSSVELATPVSKTLTYNAVTAGGGLGAVVSRTITRQDWKLVPADRAVACPLRHRHTLGEVKALRGTPNNPQNAQSSWSSSVALTSSGFCLYTTQTIPLTHPLVSQFSAPNGASGSEAALSYYLTLPVIPVLSDNLNGFAYARHHIQKDGTNLVIKRATVFTGYGWPDVDAWDYVGFLTPIRNRVYTDRPLLPLGLPYSGDHPDFVIGVNNTDGYDLKCSLGAFAPVESEIAILSPWNAAPSSPNSTIPGTLTNNTALMGALKNHLVPGYWNAPTGVPSVPTNRLRAIADRVFYAATAADTELDGACYAHTLGGEGDALDFKRFWRMGMDHEHLNNLIALVNSIDRIYPLDWCRHGVIQNGTDQTVRYRLQPNQRGILDELMTGRPADGNPWPYWTALGASGQAAYIAANAQFTGVRPAGQYASCQGYELDPVYLAASYAGIPIKTVADLPDGFAAQKIVKRRTAKVRLDFSSTYNDTITKTLGVGTGIQYLYLHTISNIQPFNITATSIGEADLATAVRPDLEAITKYFWVASSDVQAYAEAHGYKFAFPRAGVGLSLQTFTAAVSGLGIVASDFVFSYQFGQVLRVQDLVRISPSNNQARLDGLDPGLAYFTLPTPLVSSATSAETIDLKFIQFVPGSTWIAGNDGTRIQKQEMDWADQMRVGPLTMTALFDRPNGYVEVHPEWDDGVGTPVTLTVQRDDFTLAMQPFRFALNIDEVYRRMNWAGLYPTARNPADYTTDLICRDPLVAVAASGSYPNGTAVIETDIPWFKFTSDFSLSSADAAKARASFGTAVLPFTAEATGAKRVQLFADFTRSSAAT